MLIPDISQWIGRREEQQAQLDLSTAQRLGATIGYDDLNTGDPMPLLAHWCAFTPVAAMEHLSLDGHVKLGGFMPPLHQERRMWSGGSLVFHAPVHIGAEITRRSTITAITEKQGAAGAMVFVTIEHELFEGETRAISERQDIVYLDIPGAFSPPPTKPMPGEYSFMDAVDVSEALLFRFSAVTFNAHRIHYDLPYAQQVEKYPGLVVHGPLQATLLMQAALRHSGRQPRAFSFRGVHPMFHFDDMCLLGRDTGEGMELFTGIAGAHQGMQAKIIWEDAK